MRRTLTAALAVALVAVPLARSAPRGVIAAAAAATGCGPDPALTPIASRRLPGGVKARIYTAPARSAAGHRTRAQVTAVTARLGTRVDLKPVLSSVTSRRTVHAHASRRG